VIVVPKSHIRERVEYIKGPKDVANIWLLPKVRRRKKKKKGHFNWSMQTRLNWITTYKLLFYNSHWL
jgi:hypothetical protein